MNVFATLAGRLPALFRGRVSLFSASLQKRFLSWAAAASPPRAALWKDRSQSPASSNAHRAPLHELSRFLREQTRPLACSAPSLALILARTFDRFLRHNPFSSISARCHRMVVSAMLLVAKRLNHPPPDALNVAAPRDCCRFRARAQENGYGSLRVISCR